MRWMLLFFSACCLAIGPHSVTAQEVIDVRDADAVMYPDKVSYDPAVATPADFLGFELGRHPVRHHQMVEYLRLVAEQSDRITIETIGYSHQRRPIIFLAVTSPENHGRLEEIRRQHIALTEPGSGQAVTDDMPVITWANYGVHGSEASSLDAAVPFVYYLAAAQGEAIDTVLDNSVVLVTAVYNPDGHAKRVHWFDSFGGERMIADPAHAEHDYSWGETRTNHYGFDLNRQWLLLTQPEARAWMSKWHHWRPNLTLDYHEMGSNQTYYFHPGVPTRTNPLVPDRAEELLALQARYPAEFLDSDARLYFRGESFDNYYIGKGSTFPLMNGGVGVLFEAGGARGRELDTRNGLRTYRENIRKQFRTSVAGIEGAVALRREYLDYQKDFYESAVDEANGARVKAWVVSAHGDQARLHAFADLLNRHRIQTYRLARDVELEGKQFTSDEALLIPTTQPQYRMIRSLFEVADEFEDATFYDVSTWTLPPAFGLSQAAISGRTALQGEAWSPEPATLEAPAAATYGYVIEWDAYYAPRALNRVLEAGLLARVATQPFSVSTSQGDQALERGAIMVPFERQTVGRETIHALMATIAEQDGVVVHALSSGQSAIGTAGVEVGGPSFPVIEQPKILLVMGRGVSVYDAGEVWHLLDYRMKMPVTLRHRDRLDGIDWDDYTHVVLPGGNWGRQEFEWQDELRQWARRGGTIVAIRSAVSWARDLTLDRNEDDAGKDAGAADDAEEAGTERRDYADMDADDAVDIIGGAIFSADLDITHPLGFGYTDRNLFLHKNEEAPMAKTDNPYGTVIAYTQQPLYSGYASESNVEALAGTPALLAERYGRGSVILFADNPNFRGYWYGTSKLFLNSLFFSTVFDRP
ncbi:MAG: M14 family zinc carboxypeptidase [Pseudomonadota bacterium]